ncbi:unnamed protein product [Blepharisma stoltei]|uniref:Histidine kinase n=1 Tax=Blepharisma stoltei TaxID=1481888 RepID=A0AAU9JN92_9CILI|nr:unnamed protein product [Blepharisma stoltei]
MIFNQIEAFISFILLETVFKLLNMMAIISAFYGFIKLIYEILNPSAFHWTFFIPFCACNMLTLILVCLFCRVSYKHKLVLLVIIAEYYNFLFLAISKNSQGETIYEVIAFIIKIKFEFSTISSVWLFNVVLLFHEYIWHIHPWFFDPNSKIPVPYFDIFILFLLCNCGRYRLMKTSYERFQYQKELESTSNRLKIITEYSFEGIIIFSQVGNIEFYNEKSLEFMNASQDHLKVKLIATHYIPGKKIAHISSSNALIDDINYLLQNPSDEEVTLGISLSGHLDLEWKAKNIIWEGIPSIFLSIRSANQIIDLEKNIAKESIKSLILHSASHELKTPLNSIIYFATEILQNQKVLTEESKKSLSIILNSGKLMLSMISDLLDYSKILTGSLKMHKRNCNIRELIKNALSLVHFQAEKKRISLICRVDPLMPKEVFTDRDRFNQILLDLLANAIRHTIQGKIELICTVNAKNKLKCCIEDSGIEFEKRQIKALDEENSSTIPIIDNKGSGLGLYISNLLAKKLGGKIIKGKSAPGKGSAFYFTIDLLNQSRKYKTDLSINKREYDEDACPETSLSFREFMGSQNQSVLIVDDMEFNLEILSSILKNNGISYSKAQNGKIAVDKVIFQDVKNKPYRLIFMDSSMPEMDGWEATTLITQLYKEGKLNHMPIIVGYSAYNSEEDIKLCYDCGMIDFLPKPCSSEEIIRIVAKYL